MVNSHILYNLIFVFQKIIHKIFKLFYNVCVFMIVFITTNAAIGILVLDCYII